MYSYNLGLFADEIAQKFFSCPALFYTEESISYGELAEYAERLAKTLRSLDATHGDVIAICHTKKPLSYALMLACLRLGLPYVILDAESPFARSAKILETARPKLLFFDDAKYHDSMQELADHLHCPLIELGSADQLPVCSAEDIEKRKQMTASVDGETIAYIMFTSGSTGVPKGVAVTHQNVLHFIHWGQSCFSITKDDILANLSPMYFDNSVFDFYCGLFSGASLVPIERELLQNPFSLIPYIGAKGCTIWFSVPSLLIYCMVMKVMQPHLLPSLRSISFGGEGYPKVELKKLYDLFSKQARIVNVYGPTECTCICSAYHLTDADFIDLEGFPPLGHLNQNFDWFIDGAEGEEDTAGELILAGPNVSAGYYNDPKRTELSFRVLTDPKRFGKRTYATGDIVKVKDGFLFFLGRKDNQIKHMGYRIELEEIENALILLPGVSQAAVLYIRSDTAFGKIFAFVAYQGQEESSDLLAALRLHLPNYMIPAKLFLLSELPKNANGKVDRRHLRTLLEQEYAAS